MGRFLVQWEAVVWSFLGTPFLAGRLCHEHTTTITAGAFYNISFFIGKKSCALLLLYLYILLIIAAELIWVVQYFFGFFVKFSQKSERLLCSSAVVKQKGEEWLPVHNSCNIQYIESRGFFHFHGRNRMTAWIQIHFCNDFFSSILSQAFLKDHENQGWSWSGSV